MPVKVKQTGPSTKAKALMDFVNQQLGAGTLTMASDPRWQVQMLPTGISPIDHLLKGGVPLGRFIEIHGDYSSLKSYIGLSAIASAQRNGKIAALIDTEHAFEPVWAKSLGIDLDDLILRQPETGEQAVDTAEALIRGGVDLIVFDSVAAALPQAEQKKSMEDTTQMARQAALMSKAMRKLTAVNKRTGVIWINQTRVNIGVMFGNPESVPGGKALPFYATYIIGLYKSGKVQEDVAVYTTGPDGKPVKKNIKQTVGQQIRAVVYKSKLNAPFREATFVFSHSKGAVDDWGYLANIALSEGLAGYERGRWWLAEDGTRMTLDAFRGAFPLDRLKKVLQGKVEGVEWAGSAVHASKKVATARKRSSSTTTQGPTRTAVRAVSRSTARRTTRS